ncbi:MAG TPA: cell division protein FtsL [Terracidiphilus sp.]|jgi:cell division protein FtsL
MAAIATNYFETGRSLGKRISERNAELLEMQPLRRRGVRTPEFHFARHIDNSRLVKAPDPVRVREMRVFAAAITVLFSLVMIYGVQHFYAIESGYRVEADKQAVEQLREDNRQLRLSEAQLSQPSRIDSMARQLGLAEPAPGQVVHPEARPDATGPVLAKLTPPAPPVQ